MGSNICNQSTKYQTNYTQTPASSKLVTADLRGVMQNSLQERLDNFGCHILAPHVVVLSGAALCFQQLAKAKHQGFEVSNAVVLVILLYRPRYRVSKEGATNQYAMGRGGKKVLLKGATRSCTQKITRRGCRTSKLLALEMSLSRISPVSVNFFCRTAWLVKTMTLANRVIIS